MKHSARHEVLNIYARGGIAAVFVKNDSINIDGIWGDMVDKPVAFCVAMYELIVASYRNLCQYLADG